MALTAKDHPKAAPTRKPVRKTKFQADLAPAEDHMVRALKSELQLSSNTDFLSDAVTLFDWAVSERRSGHRILSETAAGERRFLIFPRLERVAPNVALPQIDIPWTQSELKSLAGLASGKAAKPTDALVRAMRK
jgi:hypothetical protein